MEKKEIKGSWVRVTQKGKRERVLGSEFVIGTGGGRWQVGERESHGVVGKNRGRGWESDDGEGNRGKKRGLDGGIERRSPRERGKIRGK